LVAATWPAAATAKELKQIKLCGESDCTTVTDRETLRLVPMGGDTPGAPPPAAAFYRVESTVDAESQTIRFRSYYVPSSNMLAFFERGYGMRWFPIVGPAAQELMRKLVEGLTPLAAPKLTRVTVGGKPVADPASYLQLTSVRSNGLAVLKDADWMQVELRSTRPTPWTIGPSSLSYSPSANVLQRGADMVQLPGSLAERIEARESLAASSSGFPWRYVVLAAALLIAAAAAGIFALVALRRGRGVAEAKPTTV
jgi:hypothetical protein